MKVIFRKSFLFFLIALTLLGTILSFPLNNVKADSVSVDSYRSMNYTNLFGFEIFDSTGKDSFLFLNDISEYTTTKKTEDTTKYESVVSYSIPFTAKKSSDYLRFNFIIDFNNCNIKNIVDYESFYLNFSNFKIFHPTSGTYEEVRYSLVNRLRDNFDVNSKYSTMRISPTYFIYSRENGGQNKAVIEFWSEKLSNWSEGEVGYITFDLITYVELDLSSDKGDDFVLGVKDFYTNKNLTSTTRFFRIFFSIILVLCLVFGVYLLVYYIRKKIKK